MGGGRDPRAFLGGIAELGASTLAGSLPTAAQVMPAQIGAGWQAEVQARTG